MAEIFQQALDSTGQSSDDISMILIRAGLIHILKCFSAGLLMCAITICLALTYAYIGGDRVDREEMHRSAGRIASYLRLVQHAEAQTPQ